MGTQQVLRIARLSLLLGAASTATAWAEPAGHSEERVVVIDLRAADADATVPGQAKPDERAQSRARLSAALARVPGVAVVPGEPGDELAWALAGEPPQANRAERATAGRALARAAAAYGDLDCQAAEHATNQAIFALSALQAATGPGPAGPDTKPAGPDVDPAGPAADAVTPRLIQAYAYALLCAHNRGDTDGALQAVQRLARLGVDSAPHGITPRIWNMYPALDVTANVPIVALRITTEPAAGRVWFDHKYMGQAPVEVYTTEGEHVVAAAGQAVDAGGVARQVDVQATGQSVDLDLPRTDTRWRAVSERVAAWREDRSGHRSGPSPGEIAALLGGLDVRMGLILSGTERVEIWGVEPGREQATRIATATTGQATQIATRIRTRARAWDRKSMDPSPALMAESRRMNTARKKTQGQKWWVYATIIGAVALGSGIILATELADDRQRIELSWP